MGNDHADGGGAAARRRIKGGPRRAASGAGGFGQGWRSPAQTVPQGQWLGRALTDRAGAGEPGLRFRSGICTVDDIVRWVVSGRLAPDHARVAALLGAGPQERVFG